MDLNDTIMSLEDEGYALVEDVIDPEESLAWLPEEGPEFR